MNTWEDPISGVTYEVKDGKPVRALSGVEQTVSEMTPLEGVGMGYRRGYERIREAINPYIEPQDETLYNEAQSQMPWAVGGGSALGGAVQTFTPGGPQAAGH